MTAATPSDLVLLHGVGLDHRMWQRCLPALNKQHRVLSLDLLGHGSSRPAAPGTTLADLAEDVAARTPDNAHLVGFSLGALVAQQVAISFPAKVRSLSLVSCVAKRSPDQTASVLHRLEQARTDFDAAVRAAITRWMSEEWQAAEPDLVQDVTATLRRTDHESYLACYRVFATADGPLYPELHRIEAPTLAITGAEDSGSTPPMTQCLAETIPHARARIIPGARHLLPLERPEPLTRALLSHTAEVAHAR
jgi:(E)-2-((N-methylformamido)methylene)succinate hydrolase